MVKLVIVTIIATKQTIPENIKCLRYNFMETEVM